MEDVREPEKTLGRRERSKILRREERGNGQDSISSWTHFGHNFNLAAVFPVPFFVVVERPLNDAVLEGGISVETVSLDLV